MKFPPFTAIAPYYDIMMSDIEYEEWVGYIGRLCPEYKQRSLRILDMAGGTGMCAVFFKKDGHEVVLFDSSHEMLDVAKQRLARENLQVEVSQGDMRQFSMVEKVDLVTCLFDSINNLTEEEQLKSCFQSVYGVLKDSGVFIFDMNTEFGLSTFWGDRTLVREDGAVLSIWRSTWDAARKIAILDLTVFVNSNDTYKRIDEVHIEKAYPAKEVLDLLSRAGFREVSMYKHLTTEKPSRFTGRIMFKGRK